MSAKSQLYINQILASSWLGQGQDKDLANMWFNVNNIIKTQDLLKKQLPYGIAASCTVVKISEGIVTIGVPSSAHASKVRQISPTIIKILHGGGYNINQVDLKVMSSLKAKYNPPKQKDVDYLNQQSLEHFKKLHESLPPGPLADAVNKLYKRHSNS